MKGAIHTAQALGKPSWFFSTLAQPLTKFCDWHDNQHKSEASVAKKPLTISPFTPYISRARIDCSVLVSVSRGLFFWHKWPYLEFLWVRAFFFLLLSIFQRNLFSFSSASKAPWALRNQIASIEVWIFSGKTSFIKISRHMYPNTEFQRCIPLICVEK